MMISNIDEQYLQTLQHSFVEDNKGVLENSLNYVDEYKYHLMFSKLNCLRAAEDLSGRAVIIGLGNGIDIPLKKIAEQFNEVAVIDMDIETVTNVCDNLSQNLREKITIVQDDISGVLVTITQQIEELFVNNNNNSNVDFDIFKLKVISILNSLKPEAYNFGEADFVCSSLILSQLAFHVQEVVKNLTKKHFYSDQANSLFHDQALQLALTEIEAKLELQHINAIYNSLVDSGKAYIGTTFSVSTTIRKGVNICKIPMLDKTLVQPNTIKQINKIFQSTEAESWIWHALQPTENSLGGMFNVMGIRATKKISE